MGIPRSTVGRGLLSVGVGATALLALFYPPLAIFQTGDFPPRWHCGDWSAIHGWIHIVSDFAIWGAYTAIPLIIVYFLRRRKDLEFPRILWLFAVFILACGTVHFLEAVIFWWPAYRLSAVTKIATAAVSWATVLALFPVLPKALMLPTRMMDIQAIIEHAPTAMLVANQRGRILMMNAQTERLFGYDRESLIGRPVETLVPEGVRGQHPSLVESYFKQPKVTQLGEGRELYGRHADGNAFPVEIGLTPLTIDGGPAVLACLVNQTIRKQRREQELTELSQVLSLGEVVGGLAHELNTPAQRIDTWAGVLQLKNPPGDYQEPLLRIRSAVQEMGEIVHRLRDAVIRRDPVDQPLDLNEMIRNTVTLMHREVTGVRIDLAEGLPFVSGDPVQLQLVLSNLIRNGYQAGGPVTITTEARGDLVVCRVDDCGPGFDVEPRQLFDSFYSTKEGGLGMGLTITQAIVRRYGGRITAHKRDHGSRFEFTLPVN